MPSNTSLVTGKVRLSYVHLFEPYSSNPDQPAKYSCVLLIPKTDQKTINDLRDAEKAALEAGKTSKFNGSIPKSWNSVIHDGDTEADLDRNPEYEGCWYMSVGTKTRPGVVDASLRPVMDGEEVYSGCYARVAINAFPYNTNGNRGVSFGLNHVQKLGDGDYLGGRSKPEDVFSSVDSDLI